MILNVSLVTIYCLDQSATRDFYVRHLGFEPRVDQTMGDDYRWVTIGHPRQPDLEVTLMTPGPPLSPEAADFVRGQLESGQMGGLGLRVDDCRKTYEELKAKGVEFVAAPEEKFYGVEAIMKDPFGNWFSMTQHK